MSPKDDPTSIGAILLRMGAVTPEALVAAVEEQSNSSIEYLLGKLLIANGVCSNEQVEVALAAQRGMRSSEDHEKALAMASIATARKRMMRAAGQHMVMKMNLVGGSGNGEGRNGSGQA